MLATALKRAIESESMSWQIHQVVFRLRAPVHIGWGKFGNLQRTRPYVTGRVFWGALTARLARESAGNSVPDHKDYQRIGNDVHRLLAYTYFYPAVAVKDSYSVIWPWEEPALFRARFLSSYSSTALSYPQQAAAEGMLHEVEYIVPYTQDRGDAVFLSGYVFERDDCRLAWQAACERLQVGGERGYGWGHVALVYCQKVDENHQIFGGRIQIDTAGVRPVISFKDESDRVLLSHTIATNLQAQGEVEPLVGREWRPTSNKRYIGQYVSLSGICFAPGSKLVTDARFVIGDFGIWQPLVDNQMSK